MQPHEIKPDTQLCTVIGYNAQRGTIRHTLNAILKRHGVNAAVIALNLTDENLPFTLANVATSKVDKMLIEPEFAAAAMGYCDVTDEAAQCQGGIDILEIHEGVRYGYGLHAAAQALLPGHQDPHYLHIAAMMIVANRWYNVPIEIDAIPTY